MAKETTARAACSCYAGELEFCDIDNMGACVKQGKNVVLIIPAAEAREFLEAVEGLAEHTKIWELRDKAREYIAKLPEEEK